MSYERQLPYLYLRGSLNSITLKNITSEEKQKVELVFHNLLQEPELHKTRLKFIKRFNRTIRADYKDDVRCSEQDYIVALWRACADLLVHRKISGFVCGGCGANSYTNKKGMVIKFNQCYHISPCCEKVMVDNVIKSPEDCTEEEFKSSMSPIAAIRGDRKYDDRLLSDREGLIKFISKHISNYQQMVIKENQRATYTTTTNTNISALSAAVTELVSVLRKHKHDVEICTIAGASEIPIPAEQIDRTQSDNFTLKFDTLSCNTDLIIQVMMILQEHSKCGIIHSLSDGHLSLSGNPDTKISVVRTAKEKISFNSGMVSSGPESNSISDGLDNLTHGGANTTPSVNHERSIEVSDIVDKIAENLCDISKTIWILQVQSSGLSLKGEPDKFEEYSTKYPGNKFNNTDLADHLGVNIGTIKRCRQEIEIHCRYYGLA
jgi:hypothetical protein